MNLDHLRVFLTIVEKGSMAAAGRELGLSATTVSERLATLEAHYGAALLHRTTRTLGLTDEGRMLVDGARSLLEEARDLESRIRRGAETLSGRIRIGAPLDLGRSVVAPVVDGFLRQHPNVSVELLLSDGYLNVIDEGIDLAVRFGDLADSTLRVRKLGEHDRVVCAAPAYVEAHGAPQTPAELEAHNCLVMRFGQNLDNVWRFRVGRRRQSVTVRGDRTTNDSALAREWAVAGHGIVCKSALDVRGDLEAERLLRLLDDFPALPLPLQMVFPPGRGQPRRVRVFADALAGAIQGPAR
ncbi:MAG: LysR family transcriptional regulator [Myxococcota bacterium]